MKEFGFPKSRRLCSQREFAAVYDRKCRAGDRHLLIFGETNDLGHSRLGVSVSKKHGNAVVRNRLKRLLREAFRLTQHDLSPPFDLILIPRQNSGAKLSDYQHSIRKLSKKLVRQILRDDQP